MASVTKAARTLIRLAVALAFWLNAVLLVQVPHPNLKPFASSVGLTPGELAIFAILLLLGTLALYGYKKSLLDTLYIYLFPFVAIYLLARLAIRVLMLLSRVLATVSPTPVPNVSTRLPSITFVANPPAEKPLPSTLPSPACLVQQNVPIEQQPARRARWGGRLLSSIMFPILNFTLLWCLLIAITTTRWILVVSLSVLIVHLCKYMWKAVRLVRYARSAPSILQSKIYDYLSGLINKVMCEPPPISSNAEFLQNVKLLATLKAVAVWAYHKGHVIHWMFVSLIVLYGLLYLRLSGIFAFVYVAIAKLLPAKFPLLDAIIVSVFMPISIRNVPAHLALQATSYIQTVLVLLGGFSVVMNYLNKRLEGVRTVVGSVVEQLQDEDVSRRLDLYGEEGGKAKVGP
jgi:hypothetical protein